MASYTSQRARIPALRQIGTWATWWWVVSGLYLVALVWRARDYYTASCFSWGRWATAIHSAFAASAWFGVLLAAIIVGWAIGTWVWLRELGRNKISYKIALKDLFFTIRK